MTRTRRGPTGVAKTSACGGSAAPGTGSLKNHHASAANAITAAPTPTHLLITAATTTTIAPKPLKPLQLIQQIRLLTGRS